MNPNQNQKGTQRLEVLEHLNGHVVYPATKRQLMEACANMSDVPKEDKDWFAKSLPDRTYNSAEEVKRALNVQQQAPQQVQQQQKQPPQQQ